MERRRWRRFQAGFTLIGGGGKSPQVRPSLLIGSVPRGGHIQPRHVKCSISRQNDLWIPPGTGVAAFTEALLAHPAQRRPEVASMAEQGSAVEKIEKRVERS